MAQRINHLCINRLERRVPLEGKPIPYSRGLLRPEPFLKGSPPYVRGLGYHPLVSLADTRDVHASRPSVSALPRIGLCYAMPHRFRSRRPYQGVPVLLLVL